MQVLIDQRYGWRHSLTEKLEYWYAGAAGPVKEFISFCEPEPEVSAEVLGAKVRSLVGHFAVVIRKRGTIIAAVDKVRSCPLFYVQKDGRFGISNSAAILKQAFGLTEIDEDSLLEFRMAAFVTGRHTLFKTLYQLQAGEMLVWSEPKGGCNRSRYYRFYSERVRREKASDLVDELDEITNTIFRRVIEGANGAPIWVPLSGGLDSRLVLCKLRQLGCERLNSFSYGPVNNYDAKWAKYVAEKISVPWLFVPFRTKAIKAFFSSQIRRDYWVFAGNYSSMPFMVDEYAIYCLNKANLVDERTIFINGQSGDFISGGHIYGKHLGKLENGGVGYEGQVVINAILKKHLSMRDDLLTESNITRLAGRITALLGIEKSQNLDRTRAFKLYEWWEWQERQAKYVINGQRSYDYFGHQWFLPLWADEYLSFWEKIGYDQKFGQKLYKTYLNKFNPFGAFRDVTTNVWNWQGLGMMVLPIGGALRIFCGDRIAKKFYHYASYLGKYHNHYAPFGLRNWLQHAKRITSPIAFYVDTYLKEERITI